MGFANKSDRSSLGLRPLPVDDCNPHGIRRPHPAPASRRPFLVEIRTTAFMEVVAVDEVDARRKAARRLGTEFGSNVGRSVEIVGAEES